LDGDYVLLLSGGIGVSFNYPDLLDCSMQEVPTFREFAGGEFRVCKDSYDARFYSLSRDFRSLFRPCRDESLAPLILSGLTQPLQGFHAAHYQELTHNQEVRFRSTLEVLEQELLSRRLRLEDLCGKIFDFGCGEGGSSILLAQRSEDVTAIDLDGSKLSELRQSRFFPTRSVISGDGIKYLLDQPASSYDLIVARNLGDYNTPLRFIKRFYGAAQRAIKRSGKIMVDSDGFTIDKVREFLGTPYQRAYAPDVVISSK